MEARDAIKAILHLNTEDETVAKVLAQRAIRQRVSAEQIVLLEGETTPAIFIVEQGGLKAIKMSPTGREQVLHFIEAGDTFNEISVMANIPNPITVMALEDSVLWKIEQAAIWEMLEAYPATAKVIIQHLAKRMQLLMLMVEDLSLRTIEARVARYLLQQSSEGRVDRARWATQAALANRLGTVPDVLHRALRTLTRENLILVERHQITILDEQNLQLRSLLDK